MKKILLSLAALVVAMLAFGETARADQLGSNWSGCEANCEWKFEWRRQRSTSNVFNAYWRHPTAGKVQANISISIKNRRVTVQRPAIGKTPPCTYTGTYRPRDVHNARSASASGTYRCGSYVGKWRATIR